MDKRYEKRARNEERKLHKGDGVELEGKTEKKINREADWRKEQKGEEK
jgi:hypothetical protein